MNVPNYLDCLHSKVLICLQYMLTVKYTDYYKCFCLKLKFTCQNDLHFENQLQYYGEYGVDYL